MLTQISLMSRIESGEAKLYVLVEFGGGEGGAVVCVEGGGGDGGSVVCVEGGGGEGGSVVCVEGGGGDGGGCDIGDTAGLGVRDLTGERGQAVCMRKIAF